MEQKDQNRLSMWKAVAHHLEANKAIWRHTPPFQRAVTALEDAIDAASEALRHQIAAGGGSRDDKETREEQAIDQVLRIAQSAKAYAMEEGDHALMAAVDYSRNALGRLPQNELVEKLRQMVAVAAVRSRALLEYGITKGEYEAALHAIEAYDQAITAPREAVAGRKAVTASVPALMKAGADILVRLDNLVHLFEAAHPQFVEAYKANRIIVDAGRRGSGDGPAEA